MDYTGGGAFYSLTPESGIEDLQNNAKRLPCKGAGTKCLRVLNKYPLQGRELGRGVEQENEILRPSSEVLSETSTTNAQNDVRAVIAGEDPQSQSCMQGNDCTLTPTHLPNGEGRKETAKFFVILNLFQNLKNFAKKNVCFTHHSSRFIKTKSPLPLFKKGDKLVAFTLAEILVTMGVIGIVAAMTMTMPMLARNYNFYIRQQQFKKAYAALSIAVEKTQIDMGEGVGCFYLNGSGVGRDWSQCTYFFEELIKNLQVIKTCENQALNKGCVSANFKGGEIVYAEVQGGDDKDAAIAEFNHSCGGFNTDYISTRNPAYLFNSGFMMMIYKPLHYDAFPFFLIDVNAHKGPNKWGHDVFLFILDKRKATDSVFYIRPAAKCSLIEKGGYYTTTFMEYLYGRSAEL